MTEGSMQSQEFTLDAHTEIEPILQHFAKVFQYNEKQLSRAHEFYFDTFDWRLYRKGFSLKRRGKYLYLSSTAGDILLREIAPAGKHFFAWDMREGALRQKIEPITGIRAISEIFFMKKESRQYTLLNKDRKTVVHLFHEQGQAGSGDSDNSLLPILRIMPVKGYEKAYSNALQIAEQAGLQGMENGQTLLKRGLATIGREPGDYASGFEVSLEREMTIEQVLNRIGLSLTDTIEQNYHGVLDDIDTEFLHDFRVAIRRTRSFLSQFKKSFPASEIKFFQSELKWLGNITGPVRDLDVYLLMKETYASMIPAELHAGLEQFFVDLKKSREEKFTEMKEGLCSKRYNELISQWKSFLEHNGDIKREPGAAGNLCHPLALKKIRKCFEKILKDGSALDSNSPDEDLHKLRIQGKKLRYLIEFFRSFFDAEEIEFFRKQLKKLQDMLGDFNDVSVQLDMLSQFQQELTGRSKRSIAIAAAIGGLVTHLSKEHEDLRKRFNAVFNEFASPQNIERFYSVLV
jgi:CHAD domain-containing protein